MTLRTAFARSALPAHLCRRLFAAGAMALATCAAPAMADVQWSWAYAASGIGASGMLTTGDSTDASGFYRITGISGSRNGAAITGLQPTGTAIPGNEPYAVDNLVGADAALTEHGFGYATDAGTYANVFFADWATPAGVIEFFTVPAQGSATELPVQFSLQRIGTVPEPASLALFGAAGLAWLGSRRRTRASVPD